MSCPATQIIVTLTVLLTAGLSAQGAPKRNPTAAASADGSGHLRRAGMRLEWTHFIAGSGREFLGELPVAVLERDGMLYFTGGTASPDFPTTPDAAQATFHGIQDAFLVKFDTRRRKVEYSTLLGGAKEEIVAPPCVDRVGNRVLIGGSTGSADFPITGDALIGKLQGPDFRHADGYLTILGNDGRALSYSTFIGGPEIDFGVWSMIVEPSGGIFVSAYAGSFEFLPANVIHSGGAEPAPGNYVMKLDAEGRRVLEARLMGDLAAGQNVQRLASGDYLIVGNTTNPEFPTTGEAFDRTYHGGTPAWGTDGGDIYVTRLSADLKTVIFTTLFGGAGDDTKPLVVTVPGGDFFVLGYTTSKDLPVATDAIEPALRSQDALFLARFSGDGRQLRYCTYLGAKSGKVERGKSLVYDGRGRIYAAWITTSLACPVTSDAAQPKHSGGADVFLLALNTVDNSLAYGSYLGGSKDEMRICLAADEGGRLYAIGNTNSDDFPPGEGLSGVRNDWDIFISKLSPDSESTDSTTRSGTH